MYLICNRKIELNVFDWHRNENQNNCFISFRMEYGTANGYTKLFNLTFLHPRGFWKPEITKHNGHARFAIGLGIFTLFFDWLDKESIIF